MIVVSDTSPIRALSSVGLLPILNRIYGEILIPPAVQQELSVPVRDLPLVNVGTLGFVQVRSPKETEQLIQLRTRLGPGEAEAIALAVQLGADALLIDEATGRRTASGLGLRLVGVIGVLIEAKRAGLVDQVAPLLETLDATITFRISSELRAHALKLAGE